jgi:pimeloyl-ACP methyl ester carboxylesterase
VLVFIHGAFVETTSAFGKLWEKHPSKVKELFDAYPGGVYALEHATLTASPVENALTLAEAAPDGTVFHLITHSRGGLVAETLARVCGDPRVDARDAGFGFTEKEERALARLRDIARDRHLTVGRVVRVACPARGTLLASKRLDALISILRWTLKLANVPVASEIVEFLGAVAARRTNPEELPGLAALLPDSPLVQWIHATGKSIDGDLRVVAGDVEASVATVSWIKQAVSDLYYRMDNDFVVQTSSMYGGAPREARASFFLDQSASVSHFSYFVNESTARAVVDGAVNDSPAGFKPIGPLSWAGNDSSGLRGGSDPSKPAVFILPGILGSNLKKNGQRLWLGFHTLGRFAELAYDGREDGVTPESPLETHYGELIRDLAATHEVIPFPFDWRKPLEVEAKRLAADIEAAIAARSNTQTGVQLIAHSMGGLLARTLQLQSPELWTRMMTHADARVLMLAVPFGGAYIPMQVLTRDNTFGNWLIMAGAPFKEKEARSLIANMPGVLQLQAGLLDGKSPLRDVATWNRLAAADLAALKRKSLWHAAAFALGCYDWGIPGQAVLAAAVSLRERLDALRESFPNKVKLVVGIRQETPSGYQQAADGALVYRNVYQGDGTVPLDSAILPGIETWVSKSDHSKMASSTEDFPAYRELLAQGTTTKLERLDGATRGENGAATFASQPVYVLSRPSLEGKNPGVPSDTRSFLSVPLAPSPAARRAPSLRVSVQNGSLQFIKRPLMVGHYRSDSLTGAEHVVDELIGNTMTAALRTRGYPSATGEQRVFVNRRTSPSNPLSIPRPEAVIVVGLGDDGALRAAKLAGTVEQGVIAWAQRRVEGERTGPFELAATLIGSGGAGVSAGSAARAIVTGVRDANERLLDCGWPTVDDLMLIEVYQERASEAWRELKVQREATREAFTLEPAIGKGTGWLLRSLDSDYRGADYDLITATTRNGADAGSIYYTLDTRRARTEVRAQSTQVKLVHELIKKSAAYASGDGRADIGKTLFRLLVPLDLRPFLSSNGRVVMQLDATTAAIPWELLNADADEGSNAPDPWAIRARLLRKFETPSYRAQVSDAREGDFILVIGNPKLTDPRYRPLKAAVREATEVAQVFERAYPRMVKALVDGADATEVMNAVFDKRYRVVHIAAHGELGEGKGVVLSDEIFLSAKEFGCMQTVPELVFVNCCHLAAADPGLPPPRAGFDAAQFAASVAHALIDIGVRCVVAAGWAVGDAAAAEFAKSFYEVLLQGRSFQDAVAEGRAAARAKGDNTWAAYQCYGDPEWRLVGAAAKTSGGATAKDFDFPTAFALKLYLDTLVSKLKYAGFSRTAAMSEIAILVERARDWVKQGDIAEAFGDTCSEANAVAEAIGWYRKAIAAPDGRCSVRASEQLANLLARDAAERIRDQKKSGAALALDAARAAIEEALSILDKLKGLAPTAERLSLRGSAFKRRALIERIAGDTRGSRDEMLALTQMKEAYAEAEGQAVKEGSARFYPGQNRLAAELVLTAARDPGPFVLSDFSPVYEGAVARAREEPDFWSVAAITELKLYETCACGTFIASLPALLKEYADLHRRVPAPRHWASVRDTADLVFGHPAVHARYPEGIDQMRALLDDFADR